MNPLLTELLIFGLLAGAANILGGAILWPPRVRHKLRNSLRYLLGLGAGFMLAVTFFEILPKTIGIWHGSSNDEETLYIPMVMLLAGYLLTQFFEHTIAPHFHLGEEVHSDSVLSSRSAYTGIGGLLIHTFLDGVSIAAAAQLDLGMGFLVFLAVFLHKFPEGFTTASMVLAAGKGRREVMIATSLIGSATFFGVILFYLLGQQFAAAVAYALPLACGVSLYVAASDLIPEINHHGGKNPLVSLSVFAGVIFFFCVHYLIHQFSHF